MNLIRRMAEFFGQSDRIQPTQGSHRKMQLYKGSAHLRTSDYWTDDKPVAAIWTDPTNLTQFIVGCGNSVERIGLYSGNNEWRFTRDDKWLGRDLSPLDYIERLRSYIDIVRDAGKVPVLVSCDCKCRIPEKTQVAQSLGIGLALQRDFEQGVETPPENLVRHY